MSNFSGNVRKSERSFKPQATIGSDAGVGKVVAGVYAGQDAPVVFEKASPVLDTAPTPRTDLRGESEIGLSGLVDHPNNDGQAIYAAAQIAREYRHITAPTGGIENLSVEQRRRMRDELVRRVGATADGAQQPEGDSTSAQATRAYVREVASLLFGLIDELSETPDFLRQERERLHAQEREQPRGNPLPALPQRELRRAQRRRRAPEVHLHQLRQGLAAGHQHQHVHQEQRESRTRGPEETTA